MSEAIDLLVTADFLYPMTEGDPVILGGEVAVKAGRILHAGPARPAGSWTPARRLDGSGKAVLPGFVNAHSHAASTVFRSQSDDGAGGGALYTVAFRMEKEIAPEEWRDLAFLGAADMIKSGITTINDIWYQPEALAEACAATGLRAEIAYKVFDVRLENLHAGDYARVPAIGAERLKRGVDLVGRIHGSAEGRVTARIGPHATDSCAPSLHQEAAAEARRLGVGLHSHVAQSRQEVAHVRAAHGKGPAAFLRDLGVLGPRSVLAHLTFADAADLDAVRETGAGYAHCPTIYPRRGVYPDMAAIRARAIPWGIATDWMMNDPFEAMRNAMNALRLLTGRVDALSSQEALRRATAGGATVLGRASEIGALAPGMRADLIMLDLEQPHLAPFYGDHASIAWYARASDVVASVIDGRVVMEGRRVLGLDEAAVIDRVKRHLPRWSGILRKLGGVTRLGACCG